MAKPKMRMSEAAAAADSTDSRRLLLDAAIRLFAKHGLDGTTVRDLAQEAGVNLCMISYHFGGKEGLYRACLEVCGRTRVEGAKGLLDPPSSVEEFAIRLRLFVTALANTNALQPEFSRLIAKEIEAGLPIAFDIFEATFLKVMSDVIQFFRSAQKAGVIREDGDPVYWAHLIYGTVGHITRCDTIGKKYFNCSITDTKSRERMVDNLVETFLRGVVKEKE